MPAERSSLALERTALGWQRSSLSLAVISALLLGHAVHRHETLGIVGSAIVAAGAGLVALSGSRLAHRRTLTRPRSAPGTLMGMMAVTVGAAIVAAAELLGSG